MTLGEVVAQNPAAAEIFDDHDIDYFCRGTRPLSDTLNEHNLSIEAFAGRLAGISSSTKKPFAEPDWQTVSLRTLITHIVETHHAYLHSELTALDKLTGRIAGQAGCDSARTSDLRRAVQRLKSDLELQMRKEEAILFPAIAELEIAAAETATRGNSEFGSVANLSRVLGQGHHRTARELQEIRLLTNNYTCSRAEQEGCLNDLFRRLRNLATDVHRHVHLENNILFPRAIELEKELNRE